jgi:peptidoglycan/LPS O-acetylase OafA/YrhL
MLATPSSSRNVPLDVLRAMAILLVFGRHLELPRPDGMVGALAEAWFRIGWIGVDLFFVLSGFLIGGLLVAELRKLGRIDIVRFLMRRGFKIYPAYYVFIAYLVAVPTLRGWLAGQDPVAVVATQWQLYWPNLLFLQNYVGTNPAGHTWSLAVEEHFYLLLPFALAWLAATGRIRALVAACAIAIGVIFLLRTASVITADPFSTRMAATHLRLDALLFGVALRAIAEFKPAWFDGTRQWRPALVAFGLACWAPNLVVDPGSPWIRTLGLSATYLGSGAFLLAAYHTRAQDFGAWAPPVRRLARVLAWIGIYSYAIYLWHVTLMGFTERQVGRLIGRFDGAPGLEWATAAIIVCSAAVLGGALMTWLVERPALAIRDRWFPSRLGTGSGVPTTPEAVEKPPEGSVVRVTPASRAGN